MKKIFSIGILFLLVFNLAACTSNNKELNKGKRTPAHESIQLKKYNNEAFKDVIVNKSDADVVVKGKARVFEGVFQYAIRIGNEVLKQDHYNTAGAPAWGEFSITINKDYADRKGVIIELFVYSAKDGSKENSLEIPLND